MVESLVALVQRVAAEYEAAHIGEYEINEKNEIRVCAATRGDAPADWGESDYRTAYLEKEAICLDGGTDPDNAKQVAFETVITHWLDRNHSPSIPSQGCAHCGKPEGRSAAVVPFGPAGYPTWVHPHCWTAWFASRRTKAITALLAIGIPMPGDSQRKWEIDTLGAKT